MTAPDRTQAPVAPGRLGQAIPADELLRYLDALRRWRDGRRLELDRIDEAALRSTDSPTYTSDLTLAMTMWQSVSDRLDALVTIWDGGRVAPQQREEMSGLIWGTGSGLAAAGAPAAGGNGAGTGAGVALSLVEACRLSDALTAALRARLSFDPVAADVAARVAATRASLQRSAESLADPRNPRPATVPDVEALRRRLDELAAKAAQGGDVSGPFVAVEASAARAERDLIVAGATHRGLSRDHRTAVARRRELEAQEDSLRGLVARAATAVTPLPKMAVPDVELLGRVPQSRAELDVYRARLESVARALAMASRAYAAALGEPAELRERLKVLLVEATVNGQANDPVVVAVHDLAQGVLAATPCPVSQARELVTAFGRLLDATPVTGSS